APLTTFSLVSVNSTSIFTPASFSTGIQRNTDKVGLLDAVLTWDPSDKLSTWVNFDYWWVLNPNNHVADQGLAGLSIWGIAGAGRYAITESTGFSLRYEYLAFNNATRSNGTGVDATLMELTGTLDHHLTDNLLVRVEGRWDKGNASGRCVTTACPGN